MKENVVKITYVVAEIVLKEEEADNSNDETLLRTRFESPGEQVEEADRPTEEEDGHWAPGGEIQVCFSSHFTNETNESVFQVNITILSVLLST